MNLEACTVFKTGLFLSPSEVQEYVCTNHERTQVCQFREVKNIATDLETWD